MYLKVVLNYKTCYNMKKMSSPTCWFLLRAVFAVPAYVTSGLTDAGGAVARRLLEALSTRHSAAGTPPARLAHCNHKGTT